jgi:hypothetical protein
MEGPSMPFRDGYNGLFDPPTLKALQEIFDAVWASVVASGASTSRTEVAQIIVRAHQSGMPWGQISEHVLQIVTAASQKPTRED